MESIHIEEFHKLQARLNKVESILFDIANTIKTTNNAQNLNGQFHRIVKDIEQFIASK